MASQLHRNLHAPDTVHGRSADAPLSRAQGTNADRLADLLGDRWLCENLGSHIAIESAKRDGTRDDAHVLACVKKVVGDVGLDKVYADIGGW